MKKITFNRVILSLLCITYIITAIFFILAIPVYGKDNEELLNYTAVFGMVVPVALGAIWLLHAIWKKDEKDEK